VEEGKMRVFITGDVHHYIGNSEDERFEYKYAKHYLQILKKYKASSTLFVTGKCIDSYPNFWMWIIKHFDVELGGHTYNAFQHEFFHKTWYRLTGREYGPWLYQWWDINRTLKAYQRIGIKLMSWRTHAYAGDNITYRILSSKGIKVVSDRFADKFQVFKENDIIHVPITTYPDDEIFTCTFSNSLTEKEIIEEQTKKVEESIIKKIDAKEDMVIQLHPNSMKVLNFSLLRRVVSALKHSGYTFHKISEVIKNVWL
jgi:peptidoglycan/xylan/chitin deacetylase (PgdA/CDA1 family)